MSSRPCCNLCSECTRLYGLYCLLLSIFIRENVLLVGWLVGWCVLQFFSSSVTYPAMGMGPLLLECHGAIDNLTMSPRFV